MPAGPWDAGTTLHSGPLEHTAQATLTFPDAGASPPTDTEAAQPGWLNLAIAGLAILLLGTAALLYVLHRRAPLRRDR